MKIMAIDYGDARTGFAISDRSEFLASPIGTVPERNAERLADKAAQTAAEYGAGEIIVGLPINMNGTEGPRAEKCRAFAELLKGRTDLPVRMWDERSTTVTAHNILNETNVRGKAKPVIEVLDGWKSDIRGIKKYEDLPENCKKYIDFVEKHIGFPITMVSNGPKREDIIYRESPLSK